MIRTFFVLSVVAVSAVAGEDLVKCTTVETNFNKIVINETYLRAGITNLTVATVVKGAAGKVYRFQKVYREGKVVFRISDMNDGLTLIAKGDSGCDVGTHFSMDGRLLSVNLMNDKLVALDHFAVTNGVLYPLPSSVISEMNSLSADVINVMPRLEREERGQPLNDKIS